MRILYYSDCYIFGGCENILASLLASPELHARHEVTFSYRRHADYTKGVALRVPATVRRRPLFLMSNDSYFHLLASARMPAWKRALMRLPFVIGQRSKLYAVYNFLALYAWFRKARPDILHINNGGYPAAATARIAVLSARLAGIKRIVFVVNNQATEPKHGLDRVFDALIRRWVSRFVCASSQACDRLAAARGMDPRRIVQIYNTVKESPRVLDRDALLDAYGFPRDCFLLVEVAFLTRRKGQIHLLEALVRIREEKPDAFESMRLLLVGDGEDRKQLEEFIAARNLGDRVRITGFQPDSSDFIGAADLFMLPSVGNEDMPLVILDAMRLGRPTVSTRVAGIEEEIRHGVDGLLLPPEEMGTRLHQAILALHGDPETRRGMGLSAQKRFEEVFSYRAFTNRYMALYRDIMGGTENGK
jgi:glycosyltransferase involved in cell wall biosynthesis